MICPYCNVNEATIFFKQVTDDVVKDLRVCASCAQKHGINIQLSLPLLSDFLFGPGVSAPVEPVTALRCPHCHMHASDLQKNGLLGCSACYGTFVDDVENMLEGMQKGRRHMGKVPEAQRENTLVHLRKGIEAAEVMGDAHEVALLRERVRLLTPRPRRAVKGRGLRSEHGAAGDGAGRMGGVVDDH